MKRPNRLLSVGLVLLFVMVVLSCFGSMIAPFAADYSDNLIYLETEKGRELFISPVAPHPPYYFGTDPWGGDVLSRMLHGLKYSMFTTLIVAALRVAAALAAVLLGGGRLRTGRIWGGLTAIPQFVIIYFILYSVNFNTTLSQAGLVAFQCILLTIFGVPSIVPSLSNSVNNLQKEEFVTVARSIGAGPVRRFFVHILPHLWERLLLLFSRETVAVLTLIGQLGVFNIFIGGTIFTPAPPLYHSVSHEWAGLLGQYRNYIPGGTWWVGLFPLVGFMVLLLAFYLTSRGLQKRIQKTYHAVSHM